MAFPAIAALVLSAVNTAYGIYKSETQEEPKEPRAGIAPPLGTGDSGMPPFSMDELLQFRPQTPEYGAGGSAFGQAMASFNPMRLADTLRPQIGMGEDRFSLGRNRRRFE